ncbi:hypothetical protein DPMN_027711 [Dreissena polymorpha]|uniref:Uncharacterized protein n=1 Tax=Dreissena polymorpha TaxID=45954 RepID=A0A9D4LXK1_DREPO|nr:hypothetical protein DPMN_027711 [Dreissena polymorpha]
MRQNRKLMHKKHTNLNSRTAYHRANSEVRENTKEAKKSGLRSNVSARGQC